MTFRKLDVFVLRCGGHLLCWVCYKELTSIPPHLKTETYPVSETLCSPVFFRILDDGQNPKKRVIPSDSCTLHVYDQLPAIMTNQMGETYKDFVLYRSEISWNSCSVNAISSYCLKLDAIRKRADFQRPIQVSRLQKCNETYHSHQGATTCSSTGHSDSPETGREKQCCIINMAFNCSRSITYLMI
jgi:hypothetical protein